MNQDIISGHAKFVFYSKAEMDSIPITTWNRC